MNCRLIVLSYQCGTRCYGSYEASTVVYGYPYLAIYDRMYGGRNGHGYKLHNLMDHDSMVQTVQYMSGDVELLYGCCTVHGKLRYTILP